MWWAQQEPDDPWVEDRLDPHPRSQWCLPTGGGDYLCHCGCLDVFPGLPTVQLHSTLALYSCLVTASSFPGLLSLTTSAGWGLGMRLQCIHTASVNLPPSSLSPPPLPICKGDSRAYSSGHEAPGPMYADPGSCS